MTGNAVFVQGCISSFHSIRLVFTMTENAVFIEVCLPSLDYRELIS